MTRFGIIAIAVISFTIIEAYTGIGAYNFGTSSFKGAGGGAVESFGVIASKLQKNFATDWQRVGLLGFGAVITGTIIGLRYWNPIFSIHPIGFAIGAALTMRSTASSILIVWIIKTVILKIGSLSLYRKAIPLFLGIIIGHMMGIGLGVIVDFIWFPGAGHPLNRW